MLEANLQALRRLIPHLTVAVMSCDPSWVAARYGVEGVPLFGFPRDPGAEAERESLLARLLEAAQVDERNATISAVASAGAIVVSGGGNLSSTWPDLFYERVALLKLAHHFGKPAAVLGQTIGPRIESGMQRLLAEALAHAGHVGVREIPSALLAAGLGIRPGRIWYQCDDAILPRDAAASPHAPAIAVTIDPQLRATSEALFGSLVDQLRALSDTIGVPLVLVPHAFGGERSGAPSDLTEARLLAERIGGGRVTIAEALDVRETRRLTAGAALVISTRYHPIVFAFSAGVPSLGIYGDDYCRIKLQGVFAHARLDRWTLTYEDVARGGLLPKALDLWSLRDDVRRHLDARREAWHGESLERWAAVLRALDFSESAQSDPSRLFGRPPEDVVPALALALHGQRQWSDSEQATIEARFRVTQRRLQAELGPRRTLARYAAALRSRLRRVLRLLS